jgi:hypothetical protein
MTILCITCGRTEEINPNEIYIKNGRYFYRHSCGRELPLIKVNGFFEPAGFGEHNEK